MPFTFPITKHILVFYPKLSVNPPILILKMADNRLFPVPKLELKLEDFTSDILEPNLFCDWDGI